jgi:hypothetical protein
MLVGLAIGLWYDVIFPPQYLPRPAPLPVLQTLAVAQTLFVLLAYPMVLLVRTGRSPGRMDWPATLAESALHLLIAGAFYIPGAFFADAVAADAFRTGLQILALYPLAWVSGALVASRPRWAPAVSLAIMVIALGLPMACYVGLEFFPPQAGTLLKNLAPAVFAWRNAAPRLDTLLPRPVWGWLIWTCVALAGGVVVSRRHRPPTPAPRL